MQLNSCPALDVAAQSRHGVPLFCGPMDYSKPGSSALHYLPDFAQIHVPWVGGAL